MTKPAPVLAYRPKRGRRKRERHIEEIERGRRYRLDFEDQCGKRRRETVVGTLTDARNRLIEVLADVKRGTYRPLAERRREQRARSVTFAEFGERFLRDYTGPNGKPRSNHYAHNIATLARALGDRRMVDLGIADVDVLKARLDDPGFWPKKRRPSRSTVRKVLIVFQTVMKAAKRWGVIHENPFTDLEKPRENEGRLEYLTRGEFDRLLAEVTNLPRKARPDSEGVVLRGAWFPPIYRLTVACGLRLGEATGLRWENVDLDQGVLYVNADNKTGRGDPIRLSERATAVLRQRRAAGESDEWVFSTPDGQSLHTTEFRSRITHLTKVAMKLAGRPSCSFHTLRHTTASWLVQAGVDLRRVQEHMRHRNIQTTLRYAHLAPEHMQDALTVLDEAVSNCHSGDTPAVVQDRGGVGKRC